MKYIKLCQLAIKYLLRYKRRYLFLFVALGFGFFLITFITSIKDRMTNNVYYTAQSHYAGDLIITSFDREIGKRNRIFGRDAVSITNIIEESKLKPSNIVYRTQFNQRGTVFFNGTGILLKYIIGVDWENERDYFENITYKNKPEGLMEDDDSMILSAPVAEQLGLKIGDSVTLEQPNIQGYSNTHDFVVRGIIEDETIFGYFKAYVSRKVLNSIIGFDEDACSSIGLFFNDRKDISRKEKVLYGLMKEHFFMGPMVSTREELDSATDENWEKGGKFFVLTLPVYLSEVGELLDALNIITYFLYIVMLLIIFVSATVTYRLILHERTREIGTMRALGFYGSDIRMVLILETVCLGIISMIAGFILAAVFGSVVSFMKFTSIPSFEIFTKNGRLIPLYLGRTLLSNVTAVVCILLPAVWFPVYNSSRSPLPEMLSGGNKL